MFTKKDLKFAVITGLITGIIAWRILSFLGAPTFGLYHPHSYFVIIVPILWIIGVKFGYFLGKWIPFFNQFGKFVAVGFTNAAVDFGVLNLLIGFTGVSDGWQYPMFKAISFSVAVTHSFILNKYWVFDAGATNSGRSEVFRFLAVNIVAIIFNVGISSIVVNYVDPISGLDSKAWANIGAVVGSACAIILTFVGSRVIVFKKKDL